MELAAVPSPCPGRACRATWHDWFESTGRPAPLPQYTGIEVYVYLIEAAIAGQSLALGWRHFIDHHIDSGALVTVTDDYVERDRGCFAKFTERGRLRPFAQRGLDAFVALANEPMRSGASIPLKRVAS